MHHGDSPSPRRRRPRYPGTHPRRFEQRYKELNPQSHPEIHEHVQAQGRTPAGTHVPVMLAEVLGALRPGPGDVAADCTLGYGGHARALLERIGPTGRFIGLDVDGAQLERTAVRLRGRFDDAAAQPPQASAGPGARATFHRSHFAGLGKVLAREGVDGCDVVLADLGCSSVQLDDPRRGFSYKHDGPLDMRMDNRLKRTAADLLTGLSVEELSAALEILADEPHHVRIARAVVERRESHPITRTRQLVKIIEAVKAERADRRTNRQQRRDDEAGLRDTEERGSHLHPAARTFQALRMLVNDEIGGLDQFLRAVPYCLRPGGRLAIISFHSGEHRRIEQALSEGLEAGIYSLISTEPVTPQAAEVYANPRSRSAELRWAVRA
ncbi:MAG: 16S rRNA (cytosine(1402)-N(4))-methyltransferase [Phycisphaerales bacterium]|nr:MAG: 16S rRNA (cytosine(1402)-N(4))-methyltransferase [Phycisphaerales bacterium]